MSLKIPVFTGELLRERDAALRLALIEGSCERRDLVVACEPAPGSSQQIPGCPWASVSRPEGRLPGGQVVARQVAWIVCTRCLMLAERPSSVRLTPALSSSTSGTAAK
jgi:hypothetical protein